MAAKARTNLQSITPNGLFQPAVKKSTPFTGPVNLSAVATPGVGRRSRLTGSLRRVTSWRHAAGDKFACFTASASPGKA
jgi:hypothetical protein